MPIVDFETSNVTPTTLTLSWDVTSNPNFTHVRITQNTGSAADVDSTQIYLQAKVNGANTFNVTGLSPNTNYHFYIHGSTSAGALHGSTSQWRSRNTKTTSETTPTGVTTAPGTPTYVITGNPGTTQNIALTWTAPSDLNGGTITGYQIQRAVETKSGNTFSVGAFADVVATTGNANLTYTDNTSGLNTNANGYFYRIRAITAQGNSAWSADNGTVVGSAPDTNAVSASVDLADRTITLTWSAVTNDKNAGIIYYDAEIINTADSTDTESSGFTDINGVTSWESPAVAYRKQFKVALTIRNAAGSATITLPTTNTFNVYGPPATPVLTVTNVYDAASEYTGSFRISWTVAYKGDIDANYSYSLLKDGSDFASGDGAFADLNGSTTDSNIVGGTEYVYKLIVDNSYSTDPGVESNTVTITATPTGPDQVDGLVVALSDDNSSLTATWNVPDANGSAITSYAVSHQKTGDSALLSSATTNSFTLESLDVGSTYTIRVAAINGVRQGRWSREESVTTPGPPAEPNKPTVTASGVNLVVTWVAPSNNGAAITDYDVEYSVDSGSTWTDLEFTGTALTYTFANYVIGTTYEFRIRATNEIGTSSWSASSDSLSLNLPGAAPGISLTVVSRNTINIVITAPTEHADDITGYTFQQRVGESGNWVTLSGLTIPGTITRTSLNPDTLYYYQVNAVNSVGSGPFVEAYGTTLKATGKMTLTASRKAPVTGSDVTLTWTTPQGYTDTEITSDSDLYYIYYLYGEDRALLHTSTALSTNSVDPFSMGSRDKNKDYYFSVTFHDNNKEYSTSGLKKFKYNGPPSVPDAPLTSIINGNSIDVYWRTPVSYSNEITTYDVRYSTDGGTNWVNTVLSDDQAHVNASGQRYLHTNVGYKLNGYTLSSLAANSSKDYATLYDAGNAKPLDLTGTSSTLWVLDAADAKLYAYTVAAGALSSTNDIELHEDNAHPISIATDGTTMWVANSADAKLYAYVVSDGSRDDTKDVTLDSANADPKGLWANATHIYVLDSNLTIYAYAVDGSRVTANDIKLVGEDLISPTSLYSNGTTLWISDISANKVLAYVFSSGARDTSKDIELDFAPLGIHSDGTTLWIIGIPPANYSYSVLATNSYGSSDYSEASTSIKIQIPGDLTNVTVKTIAEDTILLTWSEPDEAEFIASFVVERSADSGKSWTLVNATSTASDVNLYKDGTVYKFSDKQLTANTSYVYRIRSTNSAGSGGYTKSETIKTPNLPGRSGKPNFRSNYQGSYKFGNN